MPGVGPAAVATRPSFRRGFAVARDWINGHVISVRESAKRQCARNGNLEVRPTDDQGCQFGIFNTKFQKFGLIQTSLA